jgi:hypothetical protein
MKLTGTNRSIGLIVPIACAHLSANAKRLSDTRRRQGLRPMNRAICFVLTLSPQGGCAADGAANAWRRALRLRPWPEQSNKDVFKYKKEGFPRQLLILVLRLRRRNSCP